MALSKIEPLAGRHRLGAFSCGKPQLDAWLTAFARSNHHLKFTRAFVVCDSDTVIGYYGLAPTVVVPNLVNRTKLMSEAPVQIPCLMIGQLAVDQRYRGQGLGTALVRDAFRRSLAGSDLVGASALVVRAIDEDTQLFWQSWGFKASQVNLSILVRSLSDIRTWLRDYSL